MVETRALPGMTLEQPNWRSLPCDDLISPDGCCWLSPFVSVIVKFTVAVIACWTGHRLLLADSDILHAGGGIPVTLAHNTGYGNRPLAYCCVHLSPVLPFNS